MLGTSATAIVQITPTISLHLGWSQDKMFAIFYNKFTTVQIQLNLPELTKICKFCLELEAVGYQTLTNLEKVISSIKNSKGEILVMAKYDYLLHTDLEKGLVLETVFKNSHSSMKYQTQQKIQFTNLQEIQAFVQAISEIKISLNKILIFKKNLTAGYVTVHDQYQHFLLDRHFCQFSANSAIEHQKHFCNVHLDLETFISVLHWNSPYNLTFIEAMALYNFILDTPNTEMLHRVLNFDSKENDEILGLYLDILFEPGVVQIIESLESF
jgi:hypothetical protein